MITETIRRNLQSSTRWLQPAAHKCIFPASSTVSQQPTALCQAPTGFLLLIAFNFIGSYCNHFDNNCQDFLPKFWFAELPISSNIVNESRYVKDYRNTACGHNDFCSVRLNGPIYAKVSCPSGCCRIILPLLYLIATSEIVWTKYRSSRNKVTQRSLYSGQYVAGILPAPS